MAKLILFTCLFFILLSCDKVKETTKETINKGGEVVGKASTEFIEGVSEGVDKTLACDIVVSENLKKKGIETGKYSIENGSNGEKNKISIYLIFNQDFKGEIWSKVSDKSGLESGRSKLNVNAKANEAKFFDFEFDPRTKIEVKSKISFE